LTDSDDLGIV
jgi:hypothetical protein